MSISSLLTRHLNTIGRIVQHPAASGRQPVRFQHGYVVL